MPEPLKEEESFIPPPDISHLVMEDNEPVDGTFSERQMRLLVDALYDGWKTERRFLALANVGVFYGLHQPPVVPDVLLALDVVGRQDVFDRGRSYLMWEYGKPPDAVIEIVSNDQGGEEEKLRRYTTMGVPYVVIYDPEQHLGARPLRVWARHYGEHVEHIRPEWLPEVGLGLSIWEGTYQDVHGLWLRWCDEEGVLLPLGCELAERERARAEQERARAEQERARAEQERARAERLAERLRALGVDDSSL